MNCDNPNFPTDFLLEYMEHGPANGLTRFQTYTVFRFFSAIEKQDAALLSTLKSQLDYQITNDSFSVITDYLFEDLYFSPALRENTGDSLLLFYAITLMKDKSGSGLFAIDSLLSKYCPEVLKTSFDDTSLTLDFLCDDEIGFWGALYICLTSYGEQLSELLPLFSGIYWDDLHFTCEDFVLYDFADEYFETKNCLHTPEFKELIETLVLATLKSFDTNLEHFTMDAMFQLKHPSGSLSGLFSFGAMELRNLPTVDITSHMMQRILEYAAAYELRNNLYDFHLDEDNTITLTNWKDKLKWHYVQYTNVYNMALSSFYAAYLSQQLLRKDFEALLK